MKESVNFSRFCDSFSGQYSGNFSYKAKQALYDYLVNLEEETGEEYELDPVALCCEWTEYECFSEFANDYPEVGTLDDLKDRTQVIEVGDGSIIVQNY